MSSKQFHDNTYLDLVRHVLDTGVPKTDRTGTGTISSAFQQMRFDLSGGSIPLLTTKKMHLRSIIHELLWYFQGTGSGKYLKANNIRIWDEWMDADDHLDYVYGYQWRRWPLYTEKQSPTLIKIPDFTGIDMPYYTNDPAVQYRNVLCHDAGCLGIVHHSPTYHKEAFAIWTSIMDMNNDSSECFVNQDWRCFANFLHDIKYLPGFEGWRNDPTAYKLSIDYFNAKYYAKDTCIFLTHSYANQLRDNSNGEKLLLTIDGNTTEYCSVQDIATTLGYSVGYVLNIISKSITTQHDKSIHIEPINPPKGFVYRRQVYVDQLAEAIELLRDNPHNRRIIVNAWNVGQLDEMALPPCHAFIQFWSDGTHLKCHLFQRSCDVGLGVPFNIVQYSILTHIIARLTGLIATEFVWTGGDVHIYNNHIDTLNEQLTNTVLSSPQIMINERISGESDIDDITFDDIVVVGYDDEYPTIKMPVSI